MNNDTTNSPNTKQLSILLGCYGNYSHYSLRAIEGILSEAGVREQCDVHVGCNECSPTTLDALRRLANEGRIETLIESRPNLNKDPMMRLLLAVTETPYLLWMDDDSWLKPGWLEVFTRFIEQSAPLDVAGAIHCAWRWPEYDAFLRHRPWWRDEARIPHDQVDKVLFPLGGMFLSRTEFLRKNNFPDRGMVKRLDDVLLGDLVNQTGGHMIPLSEEVWQHIVISDGERRGFGEGDDGWRDTEDTSPL